MTEYNKTQLYPYRYIEKNIIHRDLLAHVFRWTHVLRLAEQHWKILDFGCGDGGLYETFYRNKFQPLRYLGLDLRSQTIDKNRLKYPKEEFEIVNLVSTD